MNGIGSPQVRAELLREAGLMRNLLLGPRSKMPFHERAARPGLEVPLKSYGFIFGGKFNRNDDRPRPMFCCEAGRSGVMPLQPLVYVAGDAHVMSGGVHLTAEDIHKPSAQATHLRVWQRRI